MLQLQLKNLVAIKLSKKVIFFIKLFLCCFCVHVGLLVFFLVSQSRVPLVINTRSSDAAVSFVPFIKSTILNQQLKATSPIKNDEQARQPAVEKKALPKKPIKTINSKTVSLKQPPLKKVSTPKKAPVKKPAPKAQAEKKAVPVKKDVKQVPKKIEKTDKVSVVPPKTELSEITTIQETLIVGNDERELFVLQDMLKKDIGKKWKRPTNIPESAVCQFRILVHKDGKRDITMEKSSSALALDISARNFLLIYDFPEQWLEKELSIQF